MRLLRPNQASPVHPFLREHLEQTVASSGVDAGHLSNVGKGPVVSDLLFGLVDEPAPIAIAVAASGTGATAQSLAMTETLWRVATDCRGRGVFSPRRIDLEWTGST